MIITQCNRECIYVNLIGYCSLDDHHTNTKHTALHCQRGQAFKRAKDREELAKIK